MITKFETQTAYKPYRGYSSIIDRAFMRNSALAIVCLRAGARENAVRRLLEDGNNEFTRSGVLLFFLLVWRVVVFWFFFFLLPQLYPVEFLRE